jgi:uncharacterized integral membrane protein
MARRKFLKWCSTTLAGHLVLFALPFWIVLSTTFLIMNYLDGTLTFSWAISIILTGLIGGIIVAVLVWFTLTSRLIKATNQRQKDRDLER